MNRNKNKHFDENYAKDPFYVTQLILVLYVTKYSTDINRDM